MQHRTCDLRAGLNLLGQCGWRVLRGAGYAPIWLLCAIGRFCRDVLHGCGRIFRWSGRILSQPMRAHTREAQKIYADWQHVRHAAWHIRCRTMLKSVLAGVFAEDGIFVSLLRWGLPIVCCGFLCSVVSYGVRLDYGIAVLRNGEFLGCIAEESDYDRAVALVQKRLSQVKSPPEIDCSRDLSLVPYDGSEPYLTAGGLADKILESAHVSFSTGYGVYRGKTFLGAVVDPTPIQIALSAQLSDYCATLDFEVETVGYAEEITYHADTYLSEALVDAQEIIDALTQVTQGTDIYTAAPNDTLYRIAERHSTTVEVLQELNPELPTLLTAGTEVVIPTQIRSLPISYTRTRQTVSFIQYDTIEIETAELPVGKQAVLQRGEKGEKQNTVRVTYVDGVEKATKLLDSVLISAPVTEQIGIGTYAAAPASASTVLYGTGEFSWPLNGGRISDVFISNRNHRGLDIAAPAGTEIYAAADGVVTVSEFSNNSYGCYIKLDHGNGYETLYAHCSLLLVTPGMEVQRGQVIAQVGSTGRSTGNHLHFEVRLDGVNYNPASFLRVNAD